ncbi:Zinc import ATP-binding protein [Modestobacter italicus]|uniref:Zinc import ATP-binding protein n=1 Tax=Modestobacter italicus (strain DSM 44449 / CECT 9708 / BC 501) TaxID=2732864 RepID=I4F4M5_MODI5|nr:ABC transporter ATP-binding protein [Modestobacter marinus]CCH90588.1 Zinc import ATP-binding protein [Modestobacter marinus]
MTTSALSLRDAGVRFGDRVLLSGLDLELQPGEFLAVLGPNGAGKSTLLKAVLGQQPLSTGELLIDGQAPGRGSDRVGYVPQQKSMDAATPLRARDLVALGIDGHRWGLRRRTAEERRRVTEALAAVGATGYADAPLGLLSGGEQQRVRIAQALATDPSLLLCDEPLLSLDLRHQRAVADMIDRRRHEHDTAVVFVTHEINPVLDLVDRVLYIAAGGHRIGPPAEVLTSETLSELYRTPVDVLNVRGRVVVVGTPDEPGGCTHHELTPEAQPAGGAA